MPSDCSVARISSTVGDLGEGDFGTDGTKSPGAALRADSGAGASGRLVGDSPTAEQARWHPASIGTPGRGARGVGISAGGRMVSLKNSGASLGVVDSWRRGELMLRRERSRAQPHRSLPATLRPMAEKGLWHGPLCHRLPPLSQAVGTSRRSTLPPRFSVLGAEAVQVGAVPRRSHLPPETSGLVEQQP